MSERFSGSRLYATLYYSWWWENMYIDAVNFCSKCVECCGVNRTGNKSKPPFNPIAIEQAFSDNRHRYNGVGKDDIMQYFLPKWLLAFPVLYLIRKLTG